MYELLANKAYLFGFITMKVFGRRQEEASNLSFIFFLLFLSICLSNDLFPFPLESLIDVCINKLTNSCLALITYCTQCIHLCNPEYSYVRNFEFFVHALNMCEF